MINALARFLARPAVADWLIRRAMRTPYFHITSDDGTDIYMERYWLFNPFQRHTGGEGRRWGDWLPSIRIHRIIREDQARHPHDHPWNARTFILRNWYIEHRLEPVRPGSAADFEMMRDHRPISSTVCVKHHRVAGDTTSIKFGEYHHIAEVSEGGAWTLFVTWKKLGTWGFLVDGKKVPWREYLGIPKKECK